MGETKVLQKLLSKNDIRIIQLVGEASLTILDCLKKIYWSYTAQRSYTVLLKELLPYSELNELG